MTFTEIQTEILERLNLTSSTASARIGRAINRKYRTVTSAVGLEISRRGTVQAAATIGVSTIEFLNTEKIINVYNRAVTPYLKLDQMTPDELRLQQPYPGNNKPTQYAIVAHTDDTVTIEINRIPQTAIVLYADVHQSVADLSGSQEPAFSESFHDVIIEGVLADEYMKLEKPALAQISDSRKEKILSDLRMWVAKGGPDIYGGKLSDATVRSSGGGGTSTSLPDGTASYTQTGLITFDRDPSAPFAVTASSAKVTNLDADKLDGTDWTTQTSMSALTSAPALTTLPALALPESQLTFTDITTGNVTSTKHGFVPKSAADATKFLNGAATPAFAQVKDSDLSTSDITTNDVSTSKHGFAPKAPNDNTRFLDGTGAFSTSGQIPFPATQNPSAGANTLDDYKEGTWTPVIGGSGGTSGQTYGNQTGFYVKIGQFVMVAFDVTLTAKGTITTSVQIQGLPFTTAASGVGDGIGGGNLQFWSNLAVAWITLNLVPVASSTTATLFGLTAAAVTTVAPTTTDIANNTRLVGSLCYRASA
jgi:hypothetical protein